MYIKKENEIKKKYFQIPEVAFCFSQVQNYLKTWEPFRDLWEVNKDLFIQR